MFKEKVSEWFLTTFLVLLLVSLISIEAQGKPTAPVSIEFLVPENLQAGDTVTTAIQFGAEADLEQLEVSVAPYEGVEIISKNETVVFQSVKQGETRAIEVTVRLLDKIGYLSVFATTSITGRVSTKAIAIRYGSAGDAPK